MMEVGYSRDGRVGNEYIVKSSELAMSQQLNKAFPPFIFFFICKDLF